MKTIKLNLSEDEKLQLRKNGVNISSLREFAADEIAVLLNTGVQRAQEVYALIAFQSIPSVGPKFARDLITMGYYTLDDLVDKDPPALLDELERKQGFRTDPCVEDQFWLVVDYARNGNTNENWWDFTDARKAYRVKNGYPADRPVIGWTELAAITV
ncbi:MAG TPA: helix-hairpin-helix domain-containing protein [Mucilaginibacter sp.]|jgi:hypothetical protein|nr:helix-hairpin-helix domain-containing protein [Mucilaginibacter sp.]